MLNNLCHHCFMAMQFSLYYVNTIYSLICHQITCYINAIYIMLHHTRVIFISILFIMLYYVNVDVNVSLAISFHVTLPMNVCCFSQK